MNISIIIPVLNEEDNIQTLIHYLRTNSSDQNIREIIVSDGGSTDHTVLRAQKAGAMVVTSKKGRAVQLNTGARHATGHIFYFLHADSFPPKHFDEKIIRKVTSSAEAGCFIMKFDNTHPFMRFWGWMTKFTGPYFRGGDQSLFITRNLFDSLQGYNEQMRIMEDYDMVYRAKNKTRFAVIKNWITTSARKYDKVGMYRLQLNFVVIYLMYILGFSQEALIHYYKQAIDKIYNHQIYNEA